MPTVYVITSHHVSDPSPSQTRWPKRYTTDTIAGPPTVAAQVDWQVARLEAEAVHSCCIHLDSRGSVNANFTAFDGVV